MKKSKRTRFRGIIKDDSAASTIKSTRKRSRSVVQESVNSTSESNDAKKRRKISHAKSVVSGHDVVSSNTRCTRSTCFVNKLPIEVLASILKYLPAADLNRASLVSRFWNEASNEACVRRSKKLVTYTKNADKVVGVLMQCNWKYLNLEFHYTRFDSTYQYSFWEKCGERIHQIDFIDCKLSDFTKLEVITRCTNLQYLSLSGFFAQYLKMLFPLKLLDRFIESNIDNRSLRNLEMQIREIRPPVVEHVMQYPLSKLCKVFPNLKWFKFIMPQHCRIPFIMHNLSSINSLMFPIFVSDFAFSVNSCDPVSFALTEITIKQYDDLNSIFDFISNHKHLEVIRCLLVGKLVGSVSQFLFSVLNSFPKLRHIEFEMRDTLLLSYELLEKLVTSRLEYLKVQCNAVLVNPALSVCQNLPLNWTLRELCLKIRTMTARFAIILEVFRNLRTLELENGNNKMLRAIWKHQTGLRNLKVKNLGSCTQLGFLGPSTAAVSARNHSLMKLERLESLEFGSQESPWKKSEKIIARFQFPVLKFLRLEIQHSSELESAMVAAAIHLPALETVEIASSSDNGTAAIKILTKFCSQLKRLQYLVIYDRTCTECREDLRNFFSVCPLLKKFAYKDKTTDVLYQYSVITQDIVETRYNK